jgi:Protein of unknown function (DUF1569)
MPTILDPTIAGELARRIDRLGPGSPALWGMMNVHQMVCHLQDAFRVALGDIPTSLRPGLLSTRLARWMIISVLPIPRGKAPTSREFKTTVPAVWAEDIAKLKELMERFIRRGSDPRAHWNVHPTFGHLSTDEYGRLVAKHMDHHLSQFGV